MVHTALKKKRGSRELEGKSGLLMSAAASHGTHEPYSNENSERNIFCPVCTCMKPLENWPLDQPSKAPFQKGEVTLREESTLMLTLCTCLYKLYAS